MRRGCRVTGLTEVLEANDKLIATPAPDEVADTQVALEPIRNLAKQGITHVMAQRVVD